jgi:hypothetical protein
MSKYVLAFRGQPDRARDPDEGQQWGAWFAGLGTAISDMGNQVGTVRTLRSEDGGDPATCKASSGATAHRMSARARAASQTVGSARRAARSASARAA